MESLGPAADQYPDGSAGAGQGDEGQVRTPFGDQQFGDDTDGVGQPRRGLRERRVEQVPVGGVGLVLDGQGFRVVRESGLDRFLSVGEVGFEVEVGQVLEQSGYLVGGVGAEVRPGQRRRHDRGGRCHGRLLAAVSARWSVAATTATATS